jgi:hypothetical protein
MRDYFRGVVMAKPAGGVYRYQITGVLVSDKPIPALEHGQLYFDGSTFGGLGDVLSACRHEPTTAPLGTADEIITGLDEHVPFLVDSARKAASGKKKRPTRKHKESE